MSISVDFLKNCNIPIGIDEEHYRSLYISNRLRLFCRHNDRTSIHTIRICRGGKAEISLVKSAQQVANHTKSGCTLATHDFYLINQDNSWGRLNVLETTFQNLFMELKLMLPFLDCICSYGFKEHEDQHNWIGCRAEVSSPSSDGSGENPRYDIFYNIHFMEKNNYTKGDCWSLRQTGVYHTFWLEPLQSQWIVLRASESARLSLEKIVKSRESAHVETADILILPHLIFMSSIKNWRAYVDHLQSQLGSLNEKAFFSKISKGPNQTDYETSFMDCQQLQLLNQKILRTRSILHSDIVVLGQFLSFWSRIQRLQKTGRIMKYDQELRYSMQEMEGQQRRLLRLLQEAKGTASILFKILEFRNEQRLRDSSYAMALSLSSLHQNSSQSSRESTVTTSLTRKTLEQSQVMKTFTLVAMLYLPTSLVASIFSSSLIQTDGGFRVSPYSWIFIILSLLLTGFTLLVVAALRRY
ncbi:hypothetical protein F5B18DRAFT_623045 [Nemania serpens]|nr:hypothetical protein F5B18DRAFT_623045 [Nemania serpens]